jgi:hypothetical protein
LGEVIFGAVCARQTEAANKRMERDRVFIRVECTSQRRPRAPQCNSENPARETLGTAYPVPSRENAAWTARAVVRKAMEPAKHWGLPTLSRGAHSLPQNALHLDAEWTGRAVPNVSPPPLEPDVFTPIPARKLREAPRRVPSRSPVTPRTPPTTPIKPTLPASHPRIPTPPHATRKHANEIQIRRRPRQRPKIPRTRHPRRQSQIVPERPQTRPHRLHRSPPRRIAAGPRGSPRSPPHRLPPRRSTGRGISPHPGRNPLASPPHRCPRIQRLGQRTVPLRRRPRGGSSRRQRPRPPGVRFPQTSRPQPGPHPRNPL